MQGRDIGRYVERLNLPRPIPGHFGNKEPEPGHRATTCVIRQLMGIDRNNCGEVGRIDKNKYQTGLLSDGNYAVCTEFYDNRSIQIKYRMVRSQGLSARSG